MAAPLAGQDKAPLATVARDFLPANQEWEFPRGRVNKKFFLDEQWEINKDNFLNAKRIGIAVSNNNMETDVLTIDK